MTNPTHNVPLSELIRHALEKQKALDEYRDMVDDHIRSEATRGSFVDGLFLGIILGAAGGIGAAYWLFT